IFYGVDIYLHWFTASAVGQSGIYFEEALNLSLLTVGTRLFQGVATESMGLTFLPLFSSSLLARYTTYLVGFLFVIYILRFILLTKSDLHAALCAFVLGLIILPVAWIH